MPWVSTRTAASCISLYGRPARAASMAESCAASTTSYTSRWAGLKVPFTGKVRVTSAVYSSYSQPASIRRRSPSRSTSRLVM